MNYDWDLTYIIDWGFLITAANFAALTKWQA